MRSRGLAIGLIVIFALCACATPAPAQSQPITKLQVRALPPEAATDLMLDRLSDVLLFEHPQNHPLRPPQTMLQDAIFYTRPRPSYYPGLCRSDQLIILFEPVRHRDRGPETPVRAVGVEATQLFHFLTPPTTPSMDSLDEVTDAQEAACAQLNPRDDDFFSAETEELAQSAAVLLLLIRQHLNDSPAAFEVVCHTRGECQTTLAQMEVARLWSVHRCVIPDASTGCITMIDGDHSLTIEARQVASVPQPMHWEIRRVHVNEVITVADSRLD